MTAAAVDLFAGPGGWDVAAVRLGLSTIGVEWEGSACLTRAAAGHLTVRADVADYPPEPFGGVAGVIGSPPCTLFSQAGSGVARSVLDALTALMHDLAAGIDSRPATRLAVAIAVGPAMAAQNAKRKHRRTNTELAADVAAAAYNACLVAEPVRWVRAVRPEWVALEQVPSVLPLWQVFARIVRGWGYNAQTAKLCAADYGVPQTRVRAIAVASRVRQVGLPSATHAEHPSGALFGSTLPWVTMADALGWAGSVGFPRKATHGDDADGDGYRVRDWRSTDRPAQVVTAKARSWTRRSCSMSRPLDGSVPRSLDQPAPTLAFGNDPGGWRWERRNDQSGSGESEAEWPLHRPATTIAGRGLVPDPGTNANRYNGAAKSRNDGYRVTEAEAATLQSFPDGYPWRGTRTAQFQQIGNAIPPLLAEAIMRAAIGAS